MAQIEQEMPWTSQQQLAHNNFWEKQTFHRLLFLCLCSLFIFKYECICDRFDCRQCCYSCAGILRWNFDDFLWETGWNVKESRVTCGSHAQLLCTMLGHKSRLYTDFLEMSLFTVICPKICFIWKAIFHAVLCVCTWIMHVTLCAVGLQWHKMNRKCLEHLSSSLLTTAAERSKVSTGCYFFAFLVFSSHHINVFVTD